MAHRDLTPRPPSVRGKGATPGSHRPTSAGPPSPARGGAGGEVREDSSVYGIQVLDRAFGILDMLEERPSRPAEIAAEVGLHRSTVFRLLANLERHGFVRKDEQSGAYCLGPRLYELGLRTVSEDLPVSRVRPLLEHLAVTTGHTAQLWLRSGHDAVCVDQVESPRDYRIVGRLGRRLPLHRGAVGKVLLALAPAGVLDSYLVAARSAAGDEQAVEPTPLRNELELIRRQGWAFSAAEYHVSACAIAAPVRGPLGLAEAAVCVLAMDAGEDENARATHATSVLDAAAAMSRILGQGGEQPENGTRARWYNASRAR